ncbi:MAG TPA: hypothetical protein VLQ80_13620, partial [Candidatus Saccharimonadia bacterium]|nr:hypothetical protein [Candidatus Saccharimonadia bacterium]
SRGPSHGFAMGTPEEGWTDLERSSFGVPAPVVRGGSDGGTGPLTSVSGRMGAKDPVGIPGAIT